MSTTLVYATIVAVLVSWLLKVYSPRQRALDAIPTIGPSGYLTSWLGVINLYRSGPKMIQEGYTKYKGKLFKVPDINRWIVIVSRPNMIDELRNAPDDVLSFTAATNDVVSVDYTLRLNNASARHNDYHMPIIRTRLTRNLGNLFPVIHDEIVAAFDDLVTPKGDEWVKLPALHTTMQIVCRATNRIFVGLPVCRNADYLRIGVGFTLDVVQSALFLNLFPRFMKPFIGARLPLVPQAVEAAEKHLRPLIEERLRKMEEYGENWSEKPNDMLQWFLEEAEGPEREVKHWTMRILLLNFAAIHTSSRPMREEVEAVLKEGGWTRASTQKMRKVDSFLRESQRMSGLGAVSLQRKVLQPFTFSDGTTVPVGVHVAAAAECVHLDEENYADADTFNGFRFAEMREEDGEGTKHSLVTTATNYLPFGHGRHACPGRFFAGTELKAMLAHLVLNYDVKLETEGVRPADNWIGVARGPNRKAEVMFRKRQF